MKKPVTGAIAAVLLAALASLPSVILTSSDDTPLIGGNTLANNSTINSSSSINFQHSATSDKIKLPAC